VVAEYYCHHLAALVQKPMRLKKSHKKALFLPRHQQEIKQLFLVSAFCFEVTF